MPIVSATASFSPAQNSLLEAQLLATIITNGLLGERNLPNHRFADPLVAQALINLTKTDGVTT